MVSGIALASVLKKHDMQLSNESSGNTQSKQFYDQKHLFVFLTLPGTALGIPTQRT